MSRLSYLAEDRLRSKRELKRFVYDLVQLEQRLASREYASSAFQPGRALCVPERTEEMVRDLEFFSSIGRAWERVLRRFLRGDESHVAELGCGPVPKAAIGLHYTDFAGTCDLIDIHEQTGVLSGKFLEMLGVRFEINVIDRSIFSIHGSQYGAVFANHLIDDLVLQAYCEGRQRDAEPMCTTQQLSPQTWRTAARSPQLLDRTMRKLVDAVFSLVHPGGFAVFLDYPIPLVSGVCGNANDSSLQACQEYIRSYAEELGGELLDTSQLEPLHLEVCTIGPENLVAFRRS